MTKSTRRPRVICHMMSSLDGRIAVRRWPDIGDLGEYERTAATYNADAWMCGRITMEPFAGATRSEDEITRERSSIQNTERPDFTAQGQQTRYAVAIDPSGRLLWQKADVDGDHVVAVLSNSVSDDYLAQLRGNGVSYIFAPPGDRDSGAGVNLRLALEKLLDSFRIRTLLLEGGGGINGSMLSAGLIDEISLLIAPVADGGVGVPTVFDLGEMVERVPATRLALEHVERRANDILWLRYSVG